jgi:autotransporter-associated beta strand protein
LLDNAGSLGNAGDTTINASTADPSAALAGSSDPSIAIAGGQIVKIPYDAALNPAGPFTVEAWLKPGAALAPGGLTCALSSVNVANPRKGWLIYQSDTGWNFRTYNENGTATAVNITGGKNGEAAPVVGTWYHVVAVWNGSEGKVYVDGELRATSAATSYIPTATTDFHLGSRSDGAFVWTGGQDEVAFYSGALSDSVIADHYANGIDSGRTTPYQTLIQASSPVGYWTGATFAGPAGPGTAPAFGDWLTAGEEWIRINPATSTRGNFWKVSGMTGSTCTIQAQTRSGSSRGSLSSVIIEEVVVPTQLVNVGVETYEAVSLASSLTSVFRPGLDAATVDVPGGFEVASTHSIDITPRPGVASGTYPLIDYLGTIGGSGFAGLALNPNPNPRYGLTLVDNVAGTSVDLAYVAPTPIIWTGATDAEWGDVATQNWKLESDSSPTRFYPYDVVKFDDTASTGTVNITTPVSPVSMVVNNTALLPYDFGGSPITGTSSLTKTGAGALTIGTANSFTGPVEILGGTVNISAGNNLGASGSGTTLSLSDATLHATQNLTLTRKMTVLGAGDVAVDDACNGEPRNATETTGTASSPTCGISVPVQMWHGESPVPAQM